ncbi:hypothetical protein F2Q69_00005609 [Brassica cretica]|uniref:Uncharacterized protein n=1 Tax=Brassica cretica TaxID=69181 RepID=A0A8S9PHU8_BRACR|nr:hypothetical protein F2Q69_00005609 [Brassica cretica]
MAMNFLVEAALGVAFEGSKGAPTSETRPSERRKKKRITATDHAANDKEKPGECEEDLGDKDGNKDGNSEDESLDGEEEKEQEEVRI